MFHVEVTEERVQEQEPRSSQSLRQVEGSQESALGAARQAAGLEAPGPTGIAGEPVRADKTPRNAPCPCGSGRKYKKCHGGGE